MNVIFIMNDSFRRDHLGCYGDARAETPNLDRFAQHAAVFDRFYAASYPTVPNRWDLCTGRYGFPFRGWQPLGQDDITWAQILSGRGVHTQMIWDTPMLGLHDYDYTRGFDGVYFVHGQKGDPWVTDPSLPIRMPAQPHKIFSHSSLATYLRNHFHRRYEREFCVGRTMSEAMDWLETNHRHESFFLYVDMWDPHEPFDCPWYDYQRYADPAYAGDVMKYPKYGRPTYMTDDEVKHTRALYAGNCTLVDRWIGHFLDTVEKLGLLKNTLIIWTTDHGHLFAEHGLQGKPFADLGTLYEITTRIPLLVHHPQGLGAGKHISGIVQPPDILPSILEFLDVPPQAQVEGESFWPLVTGEKEKIHDYAFTSRFPANVSTFKQVDASLFDGGTVFDRWADSDPMVEPSTVTDDEWAFLCPPRGLAPELYDLKRDPRQERNVVQEHPAVADRMYRAWIEFLKKHGAPESRVRPFVNPVEPLHAPRGGRLYAFRDDRGQWIAFPTEREARMYAYRDDAPGPRRNVEEVTFSTVLEDNPRNLVHLFAQYYWAEDLA